MSEMIIKGGVYEVLTDEEAAKIPEPVSGIWGTAVPQKQIKVNIVCNKCRKKKKSL